MSPVNINICFKIEYLIHRPSYTSRLTSTKLTKDSPKTSPVCVPEPVAMANRKTLIQANWWALFTLSNKEKPLLNLGVKQISHTGYSPKSSTSCVVSFSYILCCMTESSCSSKCCCRMWENGESTETFCNCEINSSCKYMGSLGF